MARELVIWCDICMLDEVKSEGVERTLTIDNLKPRKLAVCEQHDKEIIEPIRQMLLDLGQTEDGKVRPTPTAPRGPALASDDNGRVPCVLCTETSKSEGGLVQHVRLHHKMGRAEYKLISSGRLSLEQVQKGDWDAMECDDEFRCPECRQPFPPDLMEVWKQAMIQHRKRKHGVENAAANAA